LEQLHALGAVAAKVMGCTEEELYTKRPLFYKEYTAKMKLWRRNDLKFAIVRMVKVALAHKDLPGTLNGMLRRIDSSDSGKKSQFQVTDEANGFLDKTPKGYKFRCDEDDVFGNPGFRFTLYYMTGMGGKLKPSSEIDSKTLKSQEEIDEAVLERGFSPAELAFCQLAILRSLTKGQEGKPQQVSDVDFAAFLTFQEEMKKLGETSVHVKVRVPPPPLALPDPAAAAAGA